ncbi:MAG: hypothetical protein VKJ27_02640 [Synechocystis sp.]|nr:hypothetical protein [Synechocystis sp.]
MGVVMRNVLTLIALLLSSTGIFVSLAREELRCHLGLSSTACVATDQPFAPNQAVKTSGDRQGDALPNEDNGPEAERQSPIPSTAKLMESVENLREQVIPPSDPEMPHSNPDSTAAPEPAAMESTPQNDSPTTPKIPITSQENGVDTAILGDPAPAKRLPEAAPIAPPAAKIPSQSRAIPVIPAQGVAIPVTPPNQE